MATASYVPQSTLLDTINPMSYTTYNVIRDPTQGNGILHTEFFRIVVLDSDSHNEPPVVAALVVPRGRENEWLFSTQTGNKQLMERFYNISRLVLVSNTIEEGAKFDYKLAEESRDQVEGVQQYLSGILIHLHPSSLRNQPGYKIRYIRFSDGLTERMHMSSSSVPMEFGRLGRYVVTDDILAVSPESIHIARKLRYEATADMVHLEVPLKQTDIEGKKMEVDPIYSRDIKHKVDKSAEMVDPVWKAMRFGVESFFSMKEKKKRRALSLGVMGAIFLRSISTPLLEDMDIVCLTNNTFSYSTLFPFFEVELLPMGNVCSVDNLMTSIQQYFEEVAPPDTRNASAFKQVVYGKFDLIVVDVKDFKFRLFAPPDEFTTVLGIEAIKKLLNDDGVVVIHAIPSDYLSFVEFIGNMKQVFGEKAFKIIIDAEKDFVVVGGTGDCTLTEGSEGEFKAEVI